MNFRQRLAWLFLALYLVLTTATVYYIFDINDGYSAYALEHVEKYHEGKSSGKSVASLLGHVMDVPLPLWIVILVLPYLQIFSMLLACTKPDPRMSMAFLWPFYIFFKCKSLFQSLTFNEDTPKATNSPVPNGHPLIDT